MPQDSREDSAAQVVLDTVEAEVLKFALVAVFAAAGPEVLPFRLETQAHARTVVHDFVSFPLRLSETDGGKLLVLLTYFFLLTAPPRPARCSFRIGRLVY